MARRKKGRAITGWMVIDKPVGITSAGVVNKLRWALDAQKAGHAGTLDPDATGLLVVALGEATKALSALTDALKTYEFTVAWGTSTSTDDASGAVLETSDLRPGEAEILAALPGFTGDILQTPPQFSAVKVEGQRAYDLAREGEVMELDARPLYVDALELLSCGADQATFSMTCGKGGYVRSIARDLGAELGCFGHVTALRRTETGPFGEEDALAFSIVEAEERTEALAARVLPLADGLAAMPVCTCAPGVVERLSHGNPVQVMETEAEEGAEAYAFADGQPRAVGTYRAGHFQPRRVFNL